MPEQLLKVQEVMGLLNISRPIAYRLIKDGSLRSVKIGNARRVPETAIAEFIDAHTEGVAPKLVPHHLDDPRALARAEGISLAEAKRRIAGGIA